MVFEHINIEFHSLETYRMQNSEAKQSTNTHGSLKNLNMSIGIESWELIPLLLKAECHSKVAEKEALQMEHQTF